MRTVHSTITAVFATVSALSIISLALPAARAQDTGTGNAASTVGLEEIIVVARKREEKLQDVPISITAFSAQGIRDRNIQSSYDLAGFIPNFNLSANIGRRLDAPNVRGQFGPLLGGTAPNASSRGSRQIAHSSASGAPGDDLAARSCAATLRSCAATLRCCGVKHPSR